MSKLEPMISEAIYHAHVRNQNLPKKVDALTLKGELQCSHLLGELSGIERMLEYIIKHKATLTIDELEAEVHLYLQNGLNEVTKFYHGKPMYGLEDILKTHGYYKKVNDVK